MSSLPNVSVVQNANSLVLATPGVVITGPGQADLDSPLLISGRFILTEEAYKRCGCSPHRHLVLTILCQSGYGNFNPFKESLLFNNDVLEESGAYGGWFNLDAFMYYPAMKGTFYTRLSLGTELSDVVETRVG